MNDEHLDFLAQVASWYYEEGLDQSAIARRINRSRSMVSRLLDEARRAGLVEIRIHLPLERDPGREARLRDAFGLAHPIVLAGPPPDYPALLRRLGELGARYLQDCLHPGIVVGVGSGTGVYNIVRAMPGTPVEGASVVQFVGSIGGGDPMVDGAELARWLAQKLHAAYLYLSAPLLVETEAVAQGLLRERSIAAALQIGARAEVALIGVGSIRPELSSFRRAGYLTAEELAELEQMGAVGDILGRQLDANGRVLDVPVNRRVIALPDPAILRDISHVMAVAAGRAKVPAILAALRGRYVKILITDSDTADAMLAAGN